MCNGTKRLHYIQTKILNGKRVPSGGISYGEICSVCDYWGKVKINARRYRHRFDDVQKPDICTRSTFGCTEKKIKIRFRCDWCKTDQTIILPAHVYIGCLDPEIRDRITCGIDYPYGGESKRYGSEITYNFANGIAWIDHLQNNTYFTIRLHEPPINVKCGQRKKTGWFSNGPPCERSLSSSLERHFEVIEILKPKRR
ncbi:MAG: hypothetical protein ABIH67_05230 [Candidatus Uhrbacteria bacterium]